MKSILEKYIQESDSLLSQEFVAPIIDIVRIKHNGFIYNFELNKRKKTWGIIQPISSTRCKLIRDAEFFEIEKYLEKLPKFKFILIKEIGDKSWIAIPFNYSDVRQRLHLKGKGNDTFIIHLVGECSTFDHVIARFDGFNFWFESIDDNVSYECVNRLRNRILDEKVDKKGLTKEQRISLDLYIKLDKELEKKRTEDKIKNSLGIAKAELKSYVELGDNFKITWTSDDEEYSSLIRKKDLTVVSAGICLSGRDSDFDLTSIVNVIKDRESRW